MDKEDIKKLELVSENENSLEQRLGVVEKTDEIVISSLGVVSGKINMTRNFDDCDDIDIKEFTFNEFVKKLGKNIDLGLNGIKYDKVSNSFYLIVKNSSRHRGGAYRGGYWVTIPTARKLVLDDAIMEDYASDKFDKFTLVLDELCKKTQLKDKIDAENEKKERKKKEMVVKAENSPSKLSLLEAKNYYDHLKDINKQNVKDIAEKTLKIVAVATPPVAVGIATGVTLFAGHPLGIFAGALAAFSITMVEDLVFTFADKNDKYFIFKVFNYVKEWAEDISEKVKKVKMNHLKEKGLIKLYSVDKVVIPNSVTVITEPNKTEELDLDDNIMKELDVMVDKMASINSKDREILLREAKNLLITYIDRKTSIMSRDKSIIDYDADNLVALRNDMCGELAKLEIRLNDIKNKDLKRKKIIDEGKLLTDKIEKIENFESKELKAKRRILI